MIEFLKTAKAKELETTLAMSSIDINFAPMQAPDSNGYDLRACIDKNLLIYPDEVVKIHTGIHMYLGDNKYFPKDISYAGLLMPRSSSKGLILNNTIGLIDYGYQGEILVKYRNITNSIITIYPGERFAQLIIVPTYIGKLTEVTSFSMWKTARGENGFGSTGS